MSSGGISSVILAWASGTVMVERRMIQMRRRKGNSISRHSGSRPQQRLSTNKNRTAGIMCLSGGGREQEQFQLVTVPPKCRHERNVQVTFVTKCD